MKTGLGLSALCLLLAGIAGEVRADWFGLKDSAAVSSSAPKSSVAPGQASKVARVRWLDKQTNRFQTVVLQAGTTQNLGGLGVSLTKCLADYGGVGGQDLAWLEVREDKRNAPWFAGWMFNTFPEVATLDHPRYDMALVGCGDKPRARAAAPVKPGEVRDVAPPASDSEAPQGNDSESPSASNDPYYVPGVENTARETPPPAGAALAVTPTDVSTSPAATPAGSSPSAAPAAAVQPAAPSQPSAQGPVRPVPPVQPSVQPGAVPESQRVQPASSNVSDPEALQQLMDGR